MLSFYLSTVIIWMIIFWCVLKLYSKTFLKRYGEYINIDKKHSKVKSFVSLFVMSAVPILRFLIMISFFYMTFCPEKNSKDITERLKKENEDD
mgnify:FL=1